MLLVDCVRSLRIVIESSPKRKKFRSCNPVTTVLLTSKMPTKDAVMKLAMGTVYWKLGFRLNVLMTFENDLVRDIFSYCPDSLIWNS